MPGRIELGIVFKLPKAQRSAAERQDEPLRIVVLGDFSGRADQDQAEPRLLPPDRRVLAVDVDNFDALFSRFAPRITLSSADPNSPATTIGFRSLDHFHPDQLFQKLDVFRALRELRVRLLDPAGFREAAAELQRLALVSPRRSDEASSPKPAVAEPDRDTLARLLGERPTGAAKHPATAVEANVNEWIKQLVASHIVPEADPLQATYLAAVDAAIAAEMRRVLHDARFQAVEAAWRGLQWLVSSLETGEELKLYLLDAGRAELAADVAAAGGDWQRSGLHKLLVAQGPGTLGEQAWSLVIGNYTFDTSEADVKLLAALGQIASHAGGPFLAAASPWIVGCRNLVESPEPAGWMPFDDESRARWHALRTSPVAPWLGLSLPRVLLRLPYGKQTDRIAAFDFEEMTDPPEHEAFLWGNPAIACAILIGRSFLEQGWSMRPAGSLEIGDLPAFTYREQGEAKLQPCAEICWTQAAAEAVLASGLMPLVSYKSRNAAMLMRFQSLADPPTPLAGAWAL